jgi:hypothetical protein
MELSKIIGRVEVKHSESKTAWNIVNTRLGGRYKIARVPYISSDSVVLHKREMEESLAIAKFIAQKINAENI